MGFLEVSVVPHWRVLTFSGAPALLPHEGFARPQREWAVAVTHRIAGRTRPAMWGVRPAGAWLAPSCFACLCDVHDALEVCKSVKQMITEDGADGVV